MILFITQPFVYTGRPRSNASDDDDDFIVPSDSEVETRSIKSSSSRLSSASRRSGVASDDDEDFGQDEDEEPKKKRKPSGKSRSSPAKGSSKALTSSGGSATFLTAAEQREQGKKEEKKAAESPYSFLYDNVRDVSINCFCWILFSLLTEMYCFNRRRAVNPTTKIMIPRRSLFHQKRGRRLLLSKIRFVRPFFLSPRSYMLILS